MTSDKVDNVAVLHKIHVSTHITSRNRSSPTLRNYFINKANIEQNTIVVGSISSLASQRVPDKLGPSDCKIQKCCSAYLRLTLPKFCNFESGETLINL